MAILNLFDPGLVLDDISDRWYAGTAPVSRPASAAFTELSPGVYALTADPLGIDELLHVTWAYGGYFGTARWPETTRPPKEVIIPVRDPGLVVGDLSLVLIRAEALDSTPLDFEELAVGDYAVSGWDIGTSSDEYRLLWTYAEFQYTQTWRDAKTIVPGDIPETVARRMLSTYLAEAFQGSTLTSKTYCPFVPEGNTFDPENADDTAPFTPAEVQQQVGYVVMTLFPSPSPVQSFSCGTMIVGGLPVLYHLEQTILRAEFEVAIPAAVDISRGEIYTELLKTRLRNVVLSSQVPDVMLRNHTSSPIECGEWLEGDSAAFSSRLITVYFERTEPVIHAGPQEVTVP